MFLYTLSTNSIWFYKQAWFLPCLVLPTPSLQESECIAFCFVLYRLHNGGLTVYQNRCTEPIFILLL